MLLRCLSKVPIALVHQDPLYIKLINLLNERLASYTPEPFGFSSVTATYNEKTRLIFPASKIFNDAEVLEFIKSWASEVVPIFMRHLYLEIRSEDLVVNDPNNMRFQLRFRILQDREGYSLAPHKDSADTVFAFLLQLDPGNPRTSMFLKDHQTYILKCSYTDHLDVAVIETKIATFLNEMYKESVPFRISENQFGASKYVIWDGKGSVWQVNIENINNNQAKLLLTRHDGYELQVEYGSLLGLYNPLKDMAFSSQRTRHIKDSSAHGFIPSSFKVRNVLLCDMQCGFTTDDVLPSYNGFNPRNEFVIKYNKKSSKKMLTEAGFIK